MVGEKNNQYGFTLVEIIVVIVIIAILAAVAIPAFTGYIDKSHEAQDRVSVRTLNMGTRLYTINEQISIEEVFAGITSDMQRQEVLLSGEYIEEIMVPKSKDARFMWDDFIKSWYSSGIYTPLGLTFEHIRDKIIADAASKNGVYGRPWYEDIEDWSNNAGLDPAVWNGPVNYAKYNLINDRLQVRPKDGYKFSFVLVNGTEKTLKSYQHLNLNYYAKTDTWYFKVEANSEGAENNIIDIETLEILQE